MKATEQTSGQNMLEHGIAVFKKYCDLLTACHTNDFTDWKLHGWCGKLADEFVSNQLPLGVVTNYLIWHDAGKPFCRVVDNEGKVHYPDHAAETAVLLQSHGLQEDSLELIFYDMLLHTATSDLLDKFLTDEWKQYICTLFFAAVAEIHANAEMFGGLDSTSFKIKSKRLHQRGKQIARYYGWLE